MGRRCDVFALFSGRGLVNAIAGFVCVLLHGPDLLNILAAVLTVKKRNDAELTFQMFFLLFKVATWMWLWQCSWMRTQSKAMSRSMRVSCIRACTVSLWEKIFNLLSYIFPKAQASIWREAIIADWKKRIKERNESLRPFKGVCLSNKAILGLDNVCGSSCWAWCLRLPRLAFDTALWLSHRRLATRKSVKDIQIPLQSSRSSYFFFG